MQLPEIAKTVYSPVKRLQERYGLSNLFVLLFIFLLCVILITYFIPLLDFGRYIGTDDYSHVSVTQSMNSTLGMADFYTHMEEQVSNPEDPDNFYNYPFGLWLFGSLVSKTTGLSVFAGNFILIFLLLPIILLTFYVYSGTFLETKEEKIVALLFMVSMPNIVAILLNFRPSVFILPFIFIIFFIILKDTIGWKHYLVLWLSFFIITISHTGTFMFIISMLIGFFLLYCLFWGKFLRTSFYAIISLLIIYVITLDWFPEISAQYIDKSTMFLSPGNFLAEHFNFTLAQDFTRLLYENFFVGRQMIFALLFAVALYGVSRLLIIIHRKVAMQLSKKSIFPAVILPIQNLTHSAVATPLWVGPMHCILSLPGFFRLDSRGKCLSVVVLVTTLLPDMLHASEGLEVSTGALREISYLVIVIPITATLGLFWIFSFLKTRIATPKMERVVSVIWAIVLIMMIVIPAIITTYYLPQIAGEDYSIDGMKWLGNNGNLQEKVTGYGLRTVSIFTNMSEPSVAQGSESRAFYGLLRNVFSSFVNQENNVKNLHDTFDLKYILSNKKILDNLGISPPAPAIDSNPGFNKIYSTKDFGIYEIPPSVTGRVPINVTRADTSITEKGSAFEITTDYYTVSLDKNAPILNRLGETNIFGDGYMAEYFQVSRNTFDLGELPYTTTVENNQISYRTILKVNETNYASFTARYTIYPKVIKREYILSNDWLEKETSSTMPVQFSSMIFSPLTNYIITNNQESQRRHIYESQDSVSKSIKIEDIYIYKDNDAGGIKKWGIRIKNIPSSAFPTTLNYKGSTLYQMSSIQMIQTDSLPSGSSLHITQFIAVGDELGTEKEIASQNAIQLSNFPDGIHPVIVTGSASSSTDTGYNLLNQFDIPYSQIVSNGTAIIDLNDIGSLSYGESLSGSAVSEDSIKINDLIDASDDGIQGIDTNNLLPGDNIIGTALMADHGTYKDISSQETTIASLKQYSDTEGASMNGFLPTLFFFDLNTIKAIEDNTIEFILSGSVNYPIQGFFDEGYRNPKIAGYRGTPTGIVMMPVSYPPSSYLSATDRPDEIYSMWRTTLDDVADDDEMIVFRFDMEDLENPVNSDKFSSLFSYALEKGYTFTSPKRIADHFRQLQNISYSGSADVGEASITVTNKNNEMVKKVTFRVTLDKLKSGHYTTNIGKIVKREVTDTTESVYISTDIPAHTTQNLVVSPDTKGGKLVVSLPQILSEGQMQIYVTDMNGTPVQNAEVIFGTTSFNTDKEGKVTVDVPRGAYIVTVQSPGYDKFSQIIVIKGKLVGYLQYLNLI